MSRSDRAAAAGTALPHATVSRGGLWVSLAAALVLSTLAATFGRSSYPEAPPPAHTGGFGEPTCHACHFDSVPQPASEALDVRGLPSSGYTPGESYRLTVTLTREGMGRAGFQLAIRFADGPDRGAQAGTLKSDDARTEITIDGTPPVQYIHHTRAGTALTSAGTAAWSFTWIAPDGDAPISIDVSANAANDDASEFGDYVYARVYPLAAR